MPRTSYLAGAIVAALVFSASASATDFSKMVVFGDSLSDAGNISLATNPSVQPPLKFTTNPGNVAVQNIANDFNYTLTASLAGGTDYAWGGAGIFNNSPGTPSGVPTITDQVNSYLAGGSVDSNALYSIWGGANDIFYNATAAGAAATAQQLISQTISAQVAQAIAANLIPNNSTAIAAFTAQITPTVTAQVTAAVAAKAGVSSLETAAQAQAAVAAAGQQEVKLIGELQAAGVKNILVFNLPNIGVTPSATAQGAAAAASLTGLSLIYNNELNSGLAMLGKGIIPVNTYALINEVIANPTAFGFTNVTTPACGAGSSSVECGPAGSGLPYTYAAGTNNTYLFADGVHPTTAADYMLAEYVQAEIAAPGYASLLGQAALTDSTMDTRAIRDEMTADSTGAGTRTFARLDYAHQRYDATNNSPKTTSNNANLTIGADAQVNDNLSIGVALGVSHQNAGFSGGGGYSMQGLTGLGYLTWHAAGGYIGAYGNFGQNNFSDINRRIQLGALQRNESASKADGSHLGGGLNGGWWFHVSSLRTGPFANIEWETAKVNGYAEDGNDSSAMWFGRQQRDALISTLGWRLEGTWKVNQATLSPCVSVAWNHDSKAKPEMITAGLNSMNGSFEMPGFNPDKSWGTATLGISAKFDSNITTWIGYNGRFADSSQKYSSVNLGFRVGF
ncbi:autotransporter domain-containing protein [Dyella sp. A6]|uniref:autotransporter domain-containing protein n=1 Tax=Dyella aluminiiresistens TaxID=3069105 RepID=UPI002E765F3D|nr:autotransporter domain-containing protein [Dyella sp. A6]